VYKDFAYVYDRLTSDVNYKTWANYIEETFERNHVKPELVLDLGCGTGSLTVELANRGYDMIGLDLSQDMLAVAAQKAGENVLFVNQDMCEMELFGTVGAVVSTLDCINYLPSNKSLRKAFALVQNYLDPGGLFVFDVHSKYKMEKVFGDNVFHVVTDDLSYIWDCHYDGRRKVCQHDMTFFLKVNQKNREDQMEEVLYERFDEFHEERLFTKEEIEMALAEASLKVLGVFDGPTFRKATPKSERWLYVCRKEKV